MTGLVFKIYRLLLSPSLQIVFGIQCRYDESCSRYAERMIKERGVRRGFGPALKRLLSCNPYTRKING